MKVGTGYRGRRVGVAMRCAPFALLSGFSYYPLTLAVTAISNASIPDQEPPRSAGLRAPRRYLTSGLPAPETISGVIKSVKQSSMSGINQSRGTEGELWQPRFFDRALRTVEEYNEKVEYIHQNPVRAGLVSRPQDWRWSSFNEYAGLSPAEQIERCGLIIDRIRIPSDLRIRI